MSLKERIYSVLIVSASAKFNDAVRGILSASKYDPVTVAQGAAAAREMLIDLDFDLVIINSPLPDDAGIRLAVDISTGSKRSVVLLAVRAEYYAETYEQVLEHGVFVISRPMTETMLRTALDWMKCERERLRGAEKKAVSLEEKMEEIEITYKELMTWEKDSFLLVDIRDYASVEYGKIPDAVHIPEEEFFSRMAELPKEKKIVLYCMKGLTSKEPALRLRKEGFSSYHLSGGYFNYLVWQFEEEEKEAPEERNKQIEKSIQKTFHKKLFSPFAKAINRYELVKEGDKIAVCMSGGKDSMLMAKLFQELKRHNKFPFELVFLVMNPGYAPENLKLIQENAEMMKIPITIFESDIFDAVYEVEKSPCYLCARMRRGYLYNHAKELGCNKIALGHHYDDVIETILMGMLYGGQVQTMMPKLHSTNFEGMELIRPMYLIREEDIKRWRDANDLHFLQCACRFTDTCSVTGDGGEDNSKRLEIKKLIAELKKKNPFVESNIFKSVENVNLSTVIAYKKDGVKHEFLEEYEK